jgi:hypothetical protein
VLLAIHCCYLQSGFGRTDWPDTLKLDRICGIFAVPGNSTIRDIDVCASACLIRENNAHFFNGRIVVGFAGAHSSSQICGRCRSFGLQAGQ